MNHRPARAERICEAPQGISQAAGGADLTIQNIVVVIGINANGSNRGE